MNKSGLKTAPLHAGHLMIATSRVLRERTRELLLPLNIEPGHIGILDALSGGHAASQRGLGSFLRIDRTTVVRLIDELENKGLVKRQAGEDRRVNAVRITAVGEELRPKMLDAVHAAESEVLHSLTVPERNRLLSLLEKVHRSLPAFREG